MLQTLVNVVGSIGGSIVYTVVVVVSAGVVSCLSGMTISETSGRSDEAAYRLMIKGMWLGAFVGGLWAIYCLKTVTFGSACSSVLGLWAVTFLASVACVWRSDARRALHAVHI
jgi:hypothetical protein